MTDGALGFMTMHLAAGLAGQPLRRGEAPLNGGYPCYHVYRTRDGRYMSLGALEPHFWERFCAAVGREDLKTDGLPWASAGQGSSPRWRGSSASGPRPSGPPSSRSTTAAASPSTRARTWSPTTSSGPGGCSSRIDDPVGGPVPQVATPVRFVGGEGAPRRPAPGLGADTDAVLEAAGFSEDERARLASDGAVGGR